MPLVILLGLLAALLVMSWGWIERRISSTSAPDDGVGDLIAGARDAFARGDLESAIALARQALNRDANRPDAAALLARALVYHSYVDYDTDRDRAAALELTTDMIQRYASDLDLRAAHAFALSANGQPAAAAESAERVLERAPDHLLARVALALAYSAAGAHEAGLRESQRTVREHPNSVDAQRALGVSYRDTANYENATRAIDAALALNDRLIPLYYERALYALQTGDADSATYAYMQVLAIDPENVKARLRLCELSSLLREREAALTYCMQVTTRAPNWSEGWYHLGREYFLQGDWVNAQSHLDQCARLEVMQGVVVEDRRFACWYLQGQAAEIRGDCPSLIRIYNEFQAMTANRDIDETWSYPPEGPPGCG
jgi:tetratricopeptide (TPR) repeat protein